MVLLVLSGLAVLVAVAGFSFAAGYLVTYPARRRQHDRIIELTAELEAVTPKQPPQPPITISYSIGVPLGILLQHRPEINDLRDKVVEHWREHSKPDDELVH